AAVHPGAAVLVARRGEGGAGDQLRVQVEGRALRAVAALRQRAGHGLGGVLVAEAALVAQGVGGRGHGVAPRWKARYPEKSAGPKAAEQAMREHARNRLRRAAACAPLRGLAERNEVREDWGCFILLARRPGPRAARAGCRCGWPAAGRGAR